jgi:Gluconate 2-dehydrogenase subunit 3
MDPVHGQQLNDLPARRPADPKTGKPLSPLEQPGYYPGFSTLSQQKFWDEATREKVLRRVYKVPPIRFFNPEEARLMETLAAHIIPQDDRQPARRIPIVPHIDERLHKGRIPGYRFSTMPPDREAYRLGFQAIEKMAKQSYGGPFQELSWRDQDELLKSIHDAKAPGRRGRNLE